MPLNPCPECGAQIRMDVYDTPPTSELVDVIPGYVFRCACGVRLNAWDYSKPWTAEKATRSWNHHSSIWPSDAARERRKAMATAANA
ncbi:hypothetical protein OKW49_006215 [Paraburkholderia youngii]|uniref:hypothetical protein n=1 Tax=Paraburkholderia youngii TaxID=2782701 RepID=UPI003D20AD6D